MAEDHTDLGPEAQARIEIDQMLDDGQLHVTRQLTSMDYQLRIGPPKTDRARRTIPLDADTITAPRTRRHQQAEARLLRGADWVDTGLVFTRADGNPVHPDTFAQSFERQLRRSGLPKIRFHGLRHSRANNALRAGVPARVVSDILGHTVAFTLDTYARAVPAMQSDAVDLVVRVVAGDR
jgi:integrase